MGINNNLKTLKWTNHHLPIKSFSTRATCALTVAGSPPSLSAKRPLTVPSRNSSSPVPAIAPSSSGSYSTRATTTSPNVAVPASFSPVTLTSSLSFALPVTPASLSPPPGITACVSQLTGHTKDVLSVAISADDRQILTGSLDNQIKIWNTRCECKHTVDKNSHTDAVSCVKFYHAAKPTICVTASWDKTIKVWDNQYMTLMYTFIGHKGQITTLDMVNGSNYLASGSLDGHIMVWDLVKGLMLLKLDAESPINAVLFSQKIVGCTSLAWSKNSMTLYSGWTDNTIRTYNIE